MTHRQWEMALKATGGVAFFAVVLAGAFGLQHEAQLLAGAIGAVIGATIIQA